LNFQLQLGLPRPHHEATLLNLLIEKAERFLGWKPRWGFATTVAKTATWYCDVQDGIVTSAEMTASQIREYDRILSFNKP
jgi:dTDP-D-glucose 4,6-dehydratase